MNPNDIILNGSLLAAVPMALLAGIVSFISPCVLPLVPGYVSLISGTSVDSVAHERRALRTVMLNSVTFILGFSIVFVSYGLLFGSIGYCVIQPAGGKVIAAWFGPDTRGVAMGIRQAGLPLGAALGALILPTIAERHGWRAAFEAGALAAALAPQRLAGVLLVASADLAVHWVQPPAATASLAELRQVAQARCAARMARMSSGPFTARTRSVMTSPSISIFSSLTAMAALLSAAPFCKTRSVLGGRGDTRAGVAGEKSSPSRSPMSR